VSHLVIVLHKHHALQVLDAYGKLKAGGAKNQEGAGIIMKQHAEAQAGLLLNAGGKILDGVIQRMEDFHQHLLLL
jgi:hypothetical protein